MVKSMRRIKKNGPPFITAAFKNTIILASSSPRRRELLAQMGLPFSVFPVNIIEDFGELPSITQAEVLARAKVEALARLYPGDDLYWGLGADTIIEAAGKKMGKPGGREEAKEFLLSFSGQQHLVVTGLALYVGDRQRIEGTHAVTEVYFSGLTPDIVDWYLDTGEWEGAAGGYRIQGKGACLVEGIKGSYSNVMGLPIRTFFDMLLRNNYPITV
ncbi:MAG: Maf family protein [Spirochaetota bacterium]